MLYWPDVMGQFMGFLPRTLILVLSSSLFVAMVINPAICSVFIQARPRDAREKAHWVVAGYERLLRAALRHRVPVLLLGFAFLILSVQVYARYGKGVELFPDVEPRNATISVKFPQGTSIERTDATLRAVEEKLPGYPDVKFFLTTVGAQNGMAMGGGGGATHQGSIYVEFKKAGERQTNSLALIDALRRDVGVVPGAEATVEREEEGPPTGAPVSIEISGDDFETLEEYAADIVREIETVPGLVDLKTDLGKGAARDPVPRRSAPRRAAGAGHGRDRSVPAHGDLRDGKQPVPRATRTSSTSPCACRKASATRWTCSRRRSFRRRRARRCRSPRWARWNTSAGAGRSSASSRSAW
jgi:multidrug efflux pump subunit AcrB